MSEQNRPSEQDIFDACCKCKEGEDTANTVIIISSGTVTNDSDSLLETNATFMRTNFIFRQYEDVLVADLLFRNGYDANLIRTHQLLMEQDKKIMAMKEEDSDYPSIQFSLIPVELKGRYHIVMANPVIWTLTSTQLRENPNGIQMIFPLEDILIFENHDLDYNAIIAEAKARERQDAFFEQEELKKQKQIAYEAEFTPKVVKERKY